MKINREKIKANAKLSLKRKTNWIVSFPLMIIGAVQANIGFLNDALSKEQFGILSFVFGVLAFCVGFSTRYTDEKKEGE